MDDDLGDLNQYKDYRSISKRLRGIGGGTFKFNDTLACWEFSRVVKVGDIIIPKRGRTTYLGYGIVKSPYRYESSRGEYKHVIDVEWHNIGEYKEKKFPIVLKTLTDISNNSSYVSRLKEWIMKSNNYTKADALEELFIDEKEYDNIVSLLNHKKNLILEGSPGVGKSFATKRIAYSIIGKKDKSKNRNGSISSIIFIRGLY